MSEAYIIHTRPYNEKKLYLVLFSQETGVTSMAVSTKQNYHPFYPYTIIQTTSKRSRKLQASTQPPLMLTGKRLYCGLYLNELIYLFCKENDSHPDLFERYKQTLALLSKQYELEPILRQFEIALISAAGYALNLEQIQHPYLKFSLDHGLIGSHAEGPSTVSKKALMETVFEYKTSPESKRFIRHILNTILTRTTHARFFYEKLETV